MNIGAETHAQKLVQIIVLTWERKIWQGKSFDHDKKKFAKPYKKDTICYGRFVIALEMQKMAIIKKWGMGKF